MASGVEQLTANLNFSSIAKADELKKRLLFLVGALIITELGLISRFLALTWKAGGLSLRHNLRALSECSTPLLVVLYSA